MTPIASLQNVLATAQLAQHDIDISFGNWILVALPFCVICVTICWGMIVYVFNPNDVKSIPVIAYEADEHGEKRRLVTLLVCVVCVILFATSFTTTSIFGDIGIISMTFLSVIFGSGMLSTLDFNSLKWHTLILVGGGNVLGKAIQSSGLLKVVASEILMMFPKDNNWLALLLMLFFVCVVGTFVSHTVAAIVLMPIITSVGLELKCAESMVIGSAFAISAAMSLPFSSFPNVNSLLMVDDFHKSYLETKDFVKLGVPMSAITLVLIATLGLGLINYVLRV